MKEHNATLLDSQPKWEDVPPDKALICVVHNPLFDAAAYAYNRNEYEVFSLPDDPREKHWLLMDKALAEELSKFRR